MVVTVSTIEDARDCRRALAELEELVAADPARDTEAGARLEVLGALVEAYETEHCPIPPPAPLGAIRFRLEQQGLDESALVGIIGSRSRVWEVMRGRRNLTLPMIRRLHKQLGIPAESLIGAP